MRIISGDYRGKKILEPKDIKTRPLKDLTKESIFNIIYHSNKFNIELKNSNILDLFSGVGSFGIECLSRGVNHVTFVENYKNVLLILKKNLLSLKNIRNYEIIEDDIINNDFFLQLNLKYDLIFLDPPYKNKSLPNLLTQICLNKILNKNGVIVIHRHRNEQDLLPGNYRIIEEKTYGISKIIFLTFLN
ncbi:16S rRNA (guanine(966)-N(2))-methyltransferase RsmD [Candidatus Pelagibacter bacterium nBUS_32]|jgi:16S rRNA (guanine966-N2)-methyltransferase|uniref:16S rRNA (guanine(966)-N(2))-methyltransferase RsmD n=1 Tax=Candidatus Pelagibacter bacterium nBUS_32 TaxID=3374192 RepID=UPI003EBE506C